VLDRAPAGQPRAAAVTRRQTNGILCLIDDDEEEEEEEEGGKIGWRSWFDGWDQSSAVMSVIDTPLCNIYATSRSRPCVAVRCSARSLNSVN